MDALENPRHPSNVAFVFCVEPGRLEAEARLLVASIRRFGGSFSQNPLFAVQPRGVESLQPQTLAAFERAGVTHLAAPLNVTHASWPTTNKVFAMAAVEDQARSPCLAFLDTDSILLNEPAEFLLRDDVDLAVQPTLKQFNGSTGPGDPNDALWQQIYNRCDVPEPPYVSTMLDQVQIRGYYNAGLVVYRRSAALGRRWLDYLHRITPLVPPEIRYNLDQFALAAVAASLQPRLHLLPFPYNYNIACRNQFASPSRRIIDLDALIHVHYHAAFREPRFLQSLHPPLNETDVRYRWLVDSLPLAP
jgi:hypothetical protein